MALKLRYFIFYICFMVAYFTVLLILLKYPENNRQKQKIISSKIKKSDIKYILLYNKYWGRENWWLPDHMKSYDNYLKGIKCPETRCVIIPVNERKVRPLEDYDVILFHGPELKPFTEESLPDATKRKPDQVYVFARQKSPRDYLTNLVQYKNFFNFTMTYRLDSDTTWNYFNVRDSRTNTIVAPSKHVKWRDPIKSGPGPRDTFRENSFNFKTYDIIWVNLIKINS